jgi:membrane-bound lytic murein transglycosylase B
MGIALRRQSLVSAQIWDCLRRATYFTRFLQSGNNVVPPTGTALLDSPPDNISGNSDNLSSKAVVRPKAMASYEDVRIFIKDVAKKHKIPEKRLLKLFQNVFFDASVIELIERPAEKVSWTSYEKSLLSKERIDNGKKYLKTYDKYLKAAEARYGVPAELLAAIVGVESYYGTVKFRRNAITSLGTLAFEYPRRSQFFKRELENLLVYATVNSLDPLTIMGSYAGAVGIPQFMPGNITLYGVDGDNDNKIDIVTSHPDAIFSIANYIKAHGWNTGGETVDFVELGEGLTEEDFSLNPCGNSHKTVEELKKKGVKFASDYDNAAMGLLSRLDDENETYKYVVFFKNSCPIHKYNSSLKYTAAIARLAKILKGG